MKQFLITVGKLMLVAALVFCSVVISDHHQKQLCQEVMEENMAKIYAGDESRAWDDAPIEMPSPTDETKTPAGLTLVTLGAVEVSPQERRSNTIKELREAEATLGVKVSTYPLYNSEKAAEEWEADTSYCVRVDMPRVMFQDLERNTVDVVYPKSVEAGEVGKVIIRVKNKGSGAEYVTHATFVATEDLKLVYGSSNPEVTSGGEMKYGFIGDGKSLVVNFYTGATKRHYETHSGYNDWSGAYGYVKAHFYAS